MLTDVLHVREALDLWAVSNLARLYGFSKIMKPRRSE